MKSDHIQGLIKIDEHSSFINYKCEKDDFSKVIFYLSSEYSYIWLLGVHYYELENLQYKLKYFFFDFEEKERFSVSFEIQRGESFFSIVNQWKNAQFYEDRIINKTDLKRQSDYRFSSVQKDETLYLPEIKLSLESNLRQNNNKIGLRLENDTIAKAYLPQGRFDIGIENLLGQLELPLKYHALESYFPRKSLFWSHLLTFAREEAESLEVPDRAKAIRMVLLEMGRILNHLFDLHYLGQDFENHTLYVFSQLWIKKIQSLLISYSGNEFGMNIIRRGGVCLDINQSWSSRTIDELSALEKNLTSLIRDFLLNIRFNESALQVKLVHKDQVMNWSLTGPIARASGVNLDLRKRDPFYFYSDVEFEIPMGVDGTLFDLISVKIEEIVQSVGIIIQVLDNLPTGNFYSNEDPFQFFHQAEEKAEESYRNSVKNYLGKLNYSNVCFIEGPGGVLGIDINEGEGNSQLRLLGSQFSDALFLEKSLIGKNVDQVFPLWTALNLDLKEIER
ncbi:MAG: hypothetical protein CME62_01755 [Halobacteriovoraceae bacterium]|nr:hypothetical protein [Halobacteriovoraceae bacterium]